MLHDKISNAPLFNNRYGKEYFKELALNQAIRIATESKIPLLIDMKAIPNKLDAEKFIKNMKDQSTIPLSLDDSRSMPDTLAIILFNADRIYDWLNKI